MSPQLIEDIKHLTLKSKHIRLKTNGFDLFFNFAEILKNKDLIYINATGFMKSVKGEKRQVQDYFKNKQVQAYISALEKFLINEDSHYLEKGLYYKKTGRYGGTWLHRKLFLNFARWLSPEFEIICDHILEQVFEHADELKTSRQAIRQIQRPYTDIIKKHLIDTGIKTDAVYTQMAVQIKRFIGNPDDRDAYTDAQLKVAKFIMEEYRAMIVHGGKTSLSEMNDYIAGTHLNIACWERKSKKQYKNYADEITDQH